MKHRKIRSLEKFFCIREETSFVLSGTCLVLKRYLLSRLGHESRIVPLGREVVRAVMGLITD